MRLAGCVIATVSGHTSSFLRCGLLKTLPIPSSSIRKMSSELCYSNGTSFPKLEPGKLRLYSMRFCPYAQKTRLILEQKQIPYETVNINLRAKPDWFLQRNPLGLVPVLEQDSKIVYESSICNDYLDEVYPEFPLRSIDPYLWARDKILMQRFDKLISLLSRSLFGKKTDVDINQELVSNFCYLDQQLQQQGGEYFGGKQVGMIDFNIWPWFERLEALKSHYNMENKQLCPPLLSAWMERMFQLVAVKATMFDTQDHITFLKSIREGQPKYDLGLSDTEAKCQL